MEGNRKGKTAAFNLNYELIRAVSALMIILLHCGGHYDFLPKEGVTNYGFAAIAFTKSVTRTAVPFFFLIAGALAFQKEENKNAWYYYKKKYKAAMKPVFVYSLLYIMFQYTSYFLQWLLWRGEYPFLQVLINAVKGEPYYHLWFMYTMMGLYILTPFLYRFKDFAGEKVFAVLSAAVLFAGSLSILFYSDTFFIINTLQYLGYYMMGHVCRQYGKKIYRRSFFAFSLFSLLLLWGVNFYGEVNGGGYEKWALYLNRPLSFLIIITSLLLFIALSSLPIRQIPQIFQRIAHHSFQIYLLHAFFLYALTIFIEWILGIKNPSVWFYLPFLFAATTGLSFGGSILIEKYIIRRKGDARL